MKIVFLNPSAALGGAETALLDMLAALRVARPDWTMALVASGEGPLLTRAAALGIPATLLKFPRAIARLGEWGHRGSFAGRGQFALRLLAAAAPAFGYMTQLRRGLAALDPDVVHSNGLKMHLLGARTRPRGARLVWHLHDYPESRPLTARLLAMHARRCDTMIANSDSVGQHARRLFGGAIPIQTVHNAVDLERFQPEGTRADLDGLCGFPPQEGGIRIGLIGTFARWKGHRVFLDALARLRANASGIRAYIIGEPIYETRASQFSLPELRELAAAHGLADVVGFTGRVDDVPSALRALDIVVHASVEPEPFGLVVAEAMACGRPVVVSRSGGVVEIAQAGAIFHRPGDSQDLADRLYELASDAPLRTALGAAGRQAALRLFSRDRLSNTLVPIYEGLASAHENPARS